MECSAVNTSKPDAAQAGEQSALHRRVGRDNAKRRAILSRLWQAGGRRRKIALVGDALNGRAIERARLHPQCRRRTPQCVDHLLVGTTECEDVVAGDLRRTRRREVAARHIYRGTVLGDERMPKMELLLN